MYADDLLLFFAASVSGLLSMLDICYPYGLNNNIVFNYAKSVCLKIGLNWHRQISQVLLGTRKVECVTSVKYLGIMFNTGRTLKVDTSYGGKIRRYGGKCMLPVTVFWLTARMLTK